RLIARRPVEDGLWVAHGRRFSLAKQWKPAVEDFARVIDRQALPSRQLRTDEMHEYTCLRLLANDPDGCRDYCRTIAEKAGDSPDPYLAFMLARSCAGCQQPPVEPKKIEAWARQAVEGLSREAWYVHTLGLAHLRAGRWDEAQKLFE